jgi:methionine-gamma-lyase
VNYTGLATHPQHEIAKKQMKQHAPLISFELKGGIEAGKKFINAVEVCTRAVSLGTVDTLVSHPASMTHMSIPKEERIKYGITDGLIRMSVGIENIEDLEADLAQALAKAAL